jgi:hypothetical protein
MGKSINNDLDFEATYKQLSTLKDKLLFVESRESDPDLTEEQKKAVEKSKLLLLQTEDWMRKLKGLIRLDD